MRMMGVFVSLILLLICVYIPEANGGPKRSHLKVDYPDVPRVSVREAYAKYKAGKAILLQADGKTRFNKQRILGALNFTSELVRKGKIRLPNFKKRGIEIFTFCY